VQQFQPRSCVGYVQSLGNLRLRQAAQVQRIPGLGVLDGVVNRFLSDEIVVSPLWGYA
jgi:hypothetical protein